MKPRVQQSPQAINATASRWVTRRAVGLTPAESTELNTWLSEYPEHMEAYKRLSAMSDAIQRARKSGAASTIVAQLEKRARQRRVRRRAIGGAAIVTLLIAAVLYLPRFSDRTIVLSPNSDAAAVAFEPIRRLPDGSIVELKTGAEIAVRYDTATRVVDLLRGEALFRVEKDSARPFIVRAQGVDVRAVGTAFNVRLEKAAVEILVTEGKVQVADAAHGTSLLPPSVTPDLSVLAAGQKLTVDTSQLATVQTAGLVTALTNDEIKQQLAWRMPKLEFEGVDLSAAVQQMNRENRVQIMLADESLANLHLSGTFSPEDPATFARLVAATFGLKVERKSETEIVLRK